MEKLHTRKPSVNSPHKVFWDCLTQGGRVWRDDKLNNVQHWISIEDLNGDPNKIQNFGYNDLHWARTSMSESDIAWVESSGFSVGMAPDGSKFAVRFGNEISKAHEVFDRLSSGEMGDDLPILMEAFGCDYETACDAVFLQKFDVAIAMLKECVDGVFAPSEKSSAASRLSMRG